VSENTDQNAENPRETLIEQIAQALEIVDDEHERRQVPNVNDDYTNEMMWVSDTLVAARDEIERLRKAFHIEQQIVEAFYQYRMECCFDHCEAWMVEQGYRVIVLQDEDDPTSGMTEWACEVGQKED
jgi:hypothetical protein